MKPLREHRREQFLSLSDLADLADRDRTTILRIEQGTARAQPGTAWRIAQALGVPPADVTEFATDSPPGRHRDATETHGTPPERHRDATDNPWIVPPEWRSRGL